MDWRKKKKRRKLKERERERKRKLMGESEKLVARYLISPNSLTRLLDWLSRLLHEAPWQCDEEAW